MKYAKKSHKAPKYVITVVQQDVAVRVNKIYLVLIATVNAVINTVLISINTEIFLFASDVSLSLKYSRKSVIENGLNNRIVKEYNIIERRIYIPDKLKEKILMMDRIKGNKSINAYNNTYEDTIKELISSTPKICFFVDSEKAAGCSNLYRVNGKRITAPMIIR